jgi:hypothetical protein
MKTQVLLVILFIVNVGLIISHETYRKTHRDEFYDMNDYLMDLKIESSYQAELVGTYYGLVKIPFIVTMDLIKSFI